MPKVGGGRVAAIEILVSNSRTREYIEKGEKEGRSITDAMSDGEMEGVQTFDHELEKMIRNGSVTREVGLAYSSNANNLALAINDMDRASSSTEQMPDDAAVVQGEIIPGIEGFER
jgi:twitching motility protein PilT